MSDRGIHGVLTDGMHHKNPCLLIGDGVPRIHHSDGIPVYLVIESDRGIPIRCKNAALKNLLAYPSHLPAPGGYNPDRWLYAHHEQLPWNALIPCFDKEPDDGDTISRTPAGL